MMNFGMSFHPPSVPHDLSPPRFRVGSLALLGQASCLCSATRSGWSSRFRGDQGAANEGCEAVAGVFEVLSLGAGGGGGHDDAALGVEAYAR
jgi:hypothetical protein